MRITVVSDELKEAVKALDNEKRWRIVELLNESERLAYTELLEFLHIRKGSLTHHLTILMEAGMLDNYAQGDFRGPYSSYYELSPFGKDVISGLISSVEIVVTTKIPETPVETHREAISSSPLEAYKYHEYWRSSSDTPRKLPAITIQVPRHPRYSPKSQGSKQGIAFLGSDLQKRTYRSSKVRENES